MFIIDIFQNIEKQKQEKKNSYTPITRDNPLTF